MSVALPSWASTPAARDLLDAIRIERPGFFTVPLHAWTDQRRCKFKGMNARRLRQMWEAARDAAIDANDRVLWCRLGNEHPDDLIERILRGEAVPILDLEAKPLGNGRFEVCA